MMIQQRKANDNNIDLKAEYVNISTGDETDAAAKKYGPVFNSDDERITQVLLCLQSNALKFTKNGSVTIKAEAYEEGNQSYLKLAVHDTGIGISQENQKNLFKFFGFLKENTETNKNGVGLGLVIAKMIVQQFDGEINCVSEKDQGSVFSFTFKLEPIEEDDEMVDANKENT